MNYNDGVTLASRYAYSSNKDPIYINGTIYTVVETNNTNPQYKVFRNEQTGECAIAFVGSDFSDWSDVLTDMSLPGKSIPPQLIEALKIFNQCKTKYGEKLTTVVGNSLGGAIANYVALHNQGVQSITYNPAILPDDAMNTNLQSSNITNFISDTDPLDAVQDGAKLKEDHLPGRIIKVHSGSSEIETFAEDHIGFHNSQDYQACLDNLKYKASNIDPKKDKEFKENEIAFIDMGDYMPIIVDPRITFPNNPFIPGKTIYDNTSIEINSETLQNLVYSLDQIIKINNLNKNYLNIAQTIVQEHFNEKAKNKKEKTIIKSIKDIIIEPLAKLKKLKPIRIVIITAISIIEEFIQSKLLNLDNDDNFFNILDKSIQTLRIDEIKYTNKLINFRDQVNSIAYNYEQLDAQFNNSLESLSDISAQISVPIPETNLESYEDIENNLFDDKIKFLDNIVNDLINLLKKTIMPMIKEILNSLYNATLEPEVDVIKSYASAGGGIGNPGYAIAMNPTGRD